MDEPLPRKADHQAAQTSSSTDKRKSQSPPSDSRSNPPQPVPTHIEPADKAAKRQSKRIDEANLAKLVAEENASRSKFPQYPGLERWELVEKMGDGAFSNVYRARDTTGQFGEVAIKVVRKYEMNNLQVSLKRLVVKCAARLFLSIVFTSSIIVAHITLHVYPVKQFFLPTCGHCALIGKQASTYGLSENPKSSRGGTIISLHLYIIRWAPSPLDSLVDFAILVQMTSISPCHPELLTVFFLSPTASEYPQRGANYAPTGPSQHYKTHRVFRGKAILLHCSRVGTRWRVVPSNRPSHLL